MTHHHLRLKILYSIKRNTNHNEYRSTADSDVHAADISYEDRKNSDNAEEECAE